MPSPSREAHNLNRFQEFGELRLGGLPGLTKFAGSVMFAVTAKVYPKLIWTPVAARDGGSFFWRHWITGPPRYRRQLRALA